MLNTPALDKIESFFKMPFEDVLNKLHWKQNRSINSLSNLCGVSRDTFQRQAKIKGIKLRSIQDANKLTSNKGEKHWAYGKKRPEISKRMKENNPSMNNNALIKMAVSKAEYWRYNLLPQEVAFLNILSKLDVEFLSQHPINRYVIDFFIPKQNLCIEIDSVDKWGKTRRHRAFIKDTFLNNAGYKILRIPRKLLKDELAIINILKTNNIV